MALPKAIEREVAQANAAQAAIAQAAANPPDNVVNDPSQLPVANDPSAAPPPPATPPAAPSPQPDPWEQRYRSLQGIHNQQVAQLTEKVRGYETQFADLQRQLTALQEAKAAKPAEKPTADPRDVEAFGADLVDMVQRYAERVFQSMAAQFGGKQAELETRVGALEQAITGVSKKAETSMEQQFFVALENAVPEWAAVNADPKFMDWLSELDPIYGVPRKAALDVAYNALDSKRVISIFRTYIQQNPPSKPESLANQVAPTSAAAPATVVTPPPKPILSGHFVQKFYNQKALGRYTPEEAARIEAEINLAAAENRIR